MSSSLEVRKKQSDDDVVNITKAALEALVKSKVSSTASTEAFKPVFIKYNDQTSDKLIKIVNVQSDPCEPPKFRINKKIPQGPPSPPPQVLHSPPRKPTVTEQKEWKIPPCVSNWKNPRGYTIPLDKRLAVDGRGSQSFQINEKFGKFAEALNIAERKAREGIEMRAQLESKLAQKEKEKKEDYLKKLAQKAREERAGLKRKDEIDEDEEERNMIRADRERERRRERNRERAAPHIKSKHEREREVTEQIALNLTNPKSMVNSTTFDQRLGDQSRGIACGFGDDDDYNVYDKPWRSAGELTKGIYRPRDLDQDKDELSKITGKSFSGSKAGDRDGPVPFVAAGSNPQASNEDIFGIDTFLKEAKKSKRKNN